MKLYDYPCGTFPALPRAVALGFFDGVHLGHRAVLQAAVAAGAKEELTPAVFTFDALPKAGDPLCSREENRALLAAAGLAEQFTARFEAVRDLSPADFVEALARDLSAKVICCGEDFRFGAGRAGDTALLRILCEKRGIRLTVVPAVRVEGEPVSTTRIRQELRKGDLLLVNRLLGRPYTLTAPVAAGRGLGHTLGAPTLNQPLEPGCALPRFGVYLSAVTAGERTYTGVTNIGIKPTVGEDVPLAETWIPGFSGDLYGQQVPVSPVAFLRPERRFDSLEALKTQITADGETALRFVADSRRRAVLFDFDDTLQNRTLAFTAWAEDFIRRRLPAVPERERRQMAQRMTVLNGGGYAGYPRFYELVRREFGLAGPEDQVFFEDLRTRFPLHTVLLPGAAEGLARLRAAGWLVGVITNGDPLMQNRKLDASGLRPLLDTALVSGDEGVRKPDPELFVRGAARLGVAPENCVFVGDHPVNDMEGAAAAGMRPVFMDACGTFAPPEGVERVTGMAQLVSLLEGGKGL